jgi:hypothetical protein
MDKIRKVFFILLLLGVLSSETFADLHEKAPACEQLDQHPSGPAKFDSELSNDVLYPVKDVCYYHFAKDHKDAKYCSQISDIDVHTACLTALAIEAGSPNLCERVMPNKPNKKNPYISKMHHDRCIVNYVRATGDTKPCKTIQLGHSVSLTCVKGAAITKDHSSNNGK